MVKLSTLIEKQFKEKNSTEIILISVHGIETKITKNIKSMKLKTLYQ